MADPPELCGQHFGVTTAAGSLTSISRLGRRIGTYCHSGLYGLLVLRIDWEEQARLAVARSGPGKQQQEEERRTERKGLLSGGEEDDEDGRTAAS